MDKLNLNMDNRSNFERGIDVQREKFKEMKFLNDYDSMCDALENIKSEIKIKIISKERKKYLERIEKIIDWYRKIESSYTKMTPEGLQLVLPSNISYEINKNLTKCYEFLITELDLLNLL